MNRQRKIEFQTNEAQDERNQSEFKTPEGTRREGPPFPHDLNTKSHQSIAKILPLEKKGEEEQERREGRRQEIGRLPVLDVGESEREMVRGFLTPTTLNPKD